MRCPHCKNQITAPRTQFQNNALHLFFSQLAESLNDAGLDMRKVLKPTYDMPWTTTTVKEYLWKPFQKSMLRKDSTTDLNKHDEITMVHKTLMRELGQKFGLEYIPFPSMNAGEKDKSGRIKVM